jgi:hypothetical protein
MPHNLQLFLPAIAAPSIPSRLLIWQLMHYHLLPAGAWG